ncbi:Sensor histidine kinase YpdA [termite gut metagenome]|uniref:Sensor histidine kinase YpdA n=1 Tax=termite gut metagenome TaxID=433724 RepID=A0A5J4S0S2_9ZZZZ
MAKKINELVKNILLSNKRLFLLVLIGIYIILVTNSFGYGLVPALAISLSLVMDIFCMAFATIKLLIPKLLINQKKKRYLFYYLFCSIFFMAIVAKTCGYFELLFCKILDFQQISKINNGDLRYLNLTMVTFIICNVAFFRKKMQEDLKQNEILSDEKKVLEMKTLKSQINTHFLHNALNNIYSMIYFGNKDEAAKYVMKLSQMLRYVLDDCEAERIPMEKEVAYIENYIDFQKARFDTDKDIHFNYIRHTTEAVYLPPMIFQPLYKF